MAIMNSLLKLQMNSRTQPLLLQKVDLFLNYWMKSKNSRSNKITKETERNFLAFIDNTNRQI